MTPLEKDYPVAAGGWWLILVGVVAVGAGIVFVVFFWGRTPTPGSPTPAVVPTVKGTVQMLNQRSKLDFPPVVGAATSSVVALPGEIARFFGSNLRNATIEGLTYRDGRTGFAAQYVASGTLPDIFQGFVRPPFGWTLLYASRANSAAIYQADGSAYQLQILFIPIDATQVRVDMQTIKKQ